jgi:myo-inositol-1-phosphate synthase
MDLGQAGPVEAASAYFMKSPPVQKPDHIAREELEEFLAEK